MCALKSECCNNPKIKCFLCDTPLCIKRGESTCYNQGHYNYNNYPICHDCWNEDGAKARDKINKLDTDQTGGLE